MGTVIDISRKNVENCRDVLTDLDRYSVEIVELLALYPLEIEFCDYRIAFDSVDDVQILKSCLETKIGEFENSL